MEATLLPLLGTPNAVAVSVPLIISTAVAVGANKL